MDERSSSPASGSPGSTLAEPELDRPGWLEAILAAIPGIVWEVRGAPSHRSSALLVSPKVEEILGYTPAECAAIADFWLHAVPAEDRAAAAASAARGWRGGLPYTHTTRMRRRDGALVWMEHHVSFVRGAAGQPVGLRGVSFDVTERVRSEARAAAEKERLAVTLRAIREAVLTTDTVGRVTLMNPEAERLTGLSQEEALGRALAEVLRLQDPASREPLPCPAGEVLRTGGAPHSGWRVVAVSRTGGERIARCSAWPIQGEGDGGLEGVVVAVRDVAAEEARSLEAERATRITALGALAGGIAHEFNNLLTCILGNVQLARLPGASDLAGRLGAAEEAAEAARGLTQRLLAFARGGAPIRAAVDMGTLLRETATVALAGTSCRPVFDVDPDLWPALADAQQIAHVIRALVENAADAMPGGGTVTLAARNRIADEVGEGGARWVLIEVSDQGPGIPPELLPHVFDPFVSSRTPGAGLGLATAWAVVQRHGGNITVGPGPEGGTVVCLTLPVVEAPPVQRRPPVRARAGARILVMDDDPMMRATLEALLEALGYEVRCTEDGQAAVDAYRRALAERRPFDAVILDLTVPRGMGGRRAVRLLHEVDPHVRAIVSSGYSNDPVMAHAAEHGFAAVLPKPFTLADLRDVLATVLSQR